MIPTGNQLTRLELFWRQKAHQNLARWGLQSPQMLVLAMAEEVAEMADSMDHEAIEDDGAELLTELVTIGYEIRDYLEDHAEDDDGNPLPMGERPDISAPVEDPIALLAELDDLMALGYQLQARSLADYGDLRAIRQAPQEEPAEEPPAPEESTETPDNPWEGIENEGPPQ